MSDPDIDELLDARPRAPHKTCTVCWSLEQLEGETAQKMRAVVERRDIPAEKVSDLFAARGLRVATDAVQRHRRRSHGR